MARQRQRPAPEPPPRRGPTDQQLRAKGFVPFLRPEHVTEGATLRLTGFNVMRGIGTDHEQYVLEVEREDGEIYNLGVRSGSPDHRRLHTVFGPDYKQWIGRVEVTIADGRRGGKFVNVKDAGTAPPEWHFANPGFADDVPPPDDNDR